MSLNSILDFRRDAWRPGPLLPPAGGRDAVLVFVVAVLVFLACLTAMASLGANRAAQGWQSQLVGSASVLVRPTGAETPDAAAIHATEVLAGVTGVQQASMLKRAEAEDLLRPWLGGQVLTDLPIPQLVALDLDKKAPATAAALKQALTAAGVDADVDDHSMWTRQIVRAGQIARIAALGVALLLAVTTGAVIAYATRASIGAFQGVVEVLHYAGAEDRLIAGLMANRFALLSFQAALIGAAAAAALAAALRLAGGPAGLTPVLPVAGIDLSVAAVAPLAAAGVGALAARAAALQLLRRAP